MHDEFSDSVWRSGRKADGRRGERNPKHGRPGIKGANCFTAGANGPLDGRTHGSLGISQIRLKRDKKRASTGGPPNGGRLHWEGASQMEEAATDQVFKLNRHRI